MTTLLRHAKPMLGLAYLLVIALLIEFSIATFRKELPWQHTDTLLLRTPAAGLELNPHADVKLNGVTVGEVRSISSNGTEATLRLAIDPGRLHRIASNVDARIVPNTFFGAKYVSLVEPANPSTTHITAGGWITQSSTSVEIDRLFSQLGSVLDTLAPEQLSLTLDTLAQALQGRGTKLGEVFATLRTYLSRLDPHIPQLLSDLDEVTAAAGIYTKAAPDLITVLDNTRAISRGFLVPQERTFADFLAQTIHTADTADDVLATNAKHIIDFVGAARPLEQLLAAYSSEYPCLVNALNTANTMLDHVFGGEGPYLRVSIDLVVHRPGYKLNDIASNPTSTANNSVLPAGVPSWAPHCTVIPAQDRGAKDVAPYNATAGTHPISASIDTVPDPGTTQLALASTLAATRLATGAPVPGIAALLIDPLLDTKSVTLP